MAEDGGDEEIEGPRSLTLAPAYSWAAAHPAAVVAVLVAALTVMRLMAASRGDASTARAIVRYGGTANVVIGTLVGFVPLVVTVLGVAAALWWWQDRHHGGRLLVATPLVLSALLIAPIATLILGAVIGAMLTRWWSDDIAAPDALWFLAFVVVMPIAQTLLTTDDLWLPREQLSTEDGQVVGYMLGDDGGRLVALRENDRSVVFVDPADVDDRRICNAAGGGWFTRSFENRLLDLVASGTSASPAYGRCASD